MIAALVLSTLLLSTLLLSTLLLATLVWLGIERNVAETRRATYEANLLTSHATSQSVINGLEGALVKLKHSIPSLIAQERIKAVATSRHVIKGKISEEMMPLLPGFPFQPSDCKFMGAPVDYIVFEGMSEGEVTSITILEVKTGNAQLNDRQRQIRRAVETGQVFFREVKMGGVVPAEVAP